MSNRRMGKSIVQWFEENSGEKWHRKISGDAYTKSRRSAMMALLVIFASDRINEPCAGVAGA